MLNNKGGKSIINLFKNLLTVKLWDWKVWVILKFNMTKIKIRIVLRKYITKWFRSKIINLDKETGKRIWELKLVWMRIIWMKINTESKLIKIIRNKKVSTKDYYLVYSNSPVVLEVNMEIGI